MKMFCLIFTSLTNGVKVLVNDVKYNKNNNTLLMPIRRNKVTGFENNFFGRSLSINYDNSTVVNSHLIIKDIKSIIINNKCCSYDEITVLFGVQIESGMLYISSVEEERGDLMFEAKMEINKINIELTDV